MVIWNQVQKHRWRKVKGQRLRCRPSQLVRRRRRSSWSRSMISEASIRCPSVSQGKEKGCCTITMKQLVDGWLQRQRLKFIALVITEWPSDQAIWPVGLRKGWKESHSAKVTQPGLGMQQHITFLSALSPVLVWECIHVCEVLKKNSTTGLTKSQKKE